jgi:pyruvate dehydrogenase E2 component (dihydrolipoamide acetyltransferase)
MTREVKLPEISENIHEATIVKILVTEGEQVEEEQSLMEIETDKALSELPSPAAGTIREIKVKEGDEVEIGGVIMILEETGRGKKDNEKKEKVEEASGKFIDTDDKEKKRQLEKEGKTAEIKSEKKGEEKGEPGKKTSAEVESGVKKRDSEEKQKRKETEPSGEKEEESEPEMSEIDQGKRIPVPASPSVRRFAREIGVNIRQVEGTGPGNRILIDDVKAFAREKISGEQSIGMYGMGVSLPDFSKWGDIERKPMDKIRIITAQNTWKSWNANPHVTQFDKADITGLEQFRNQYANQVEKAGGKLTITAILLKVAGFALQQFPRFNSSVDVQNREIILKKYIHIGVAVDTDRGLLVPVVQHVDKKSLEELSVELGSLAEKARNKKISMEEMEGGNFVISNLGGIGGTNFTPVIFPPQVAILGVARSEIQPVYLDGDFRPRLILPLNVSYDHKVVDGADGSRFLRWICKALEDPMSIFLGKYE